MKFTIVISLLLLNGCTFLKVRPPHIELPPNTCAVQYTKIDLVNVKTAQDIILNATKTMLYIEYLQNIINTQDQCYKEIIKSIQNTD